MTELEILAKKAESSGGLAGRTGSDSNFFYCNKIDNTSSSYELEEIAICRLCNATMGIRFVADNYKKDIILTDLESITFT
jgi:hypothetical protein